jgi:hypothetical protein
MGLNQLITSDAKRRSHTGDPDEVQARYHEALNYLVAVAEAKGNPALTLRQRPAAAPQFAPRPDTGNGGVTMRPDYFAGQRPTVDFFAPQRTNRVPQWR